MAPQYFAWHSEARQVLSTETTPQGAHVLPGDTGPIPRQGDCRCNVSRRKTRWESVAFTILDDIGGPV